MGRDEGDQLTALPSTPSSEHRAPTERWAEPAASNDGPGASVEEGPVRSAPRQTHAGPPPSDPDLPRDTRTGRLGLVVAAALSLIIFVFFNWPRPDGLSDLTRPLLLLDTTPSGGDMGAHVWGPAFLRDHLLPEFRLSGWTPDWYAGFPAYHFYMVVPPLAIIAINAGLPWFLGLPLAALVIAGAREATKRVETFPKALIWAAGILLAVMAVAVPYGISFKLVSVFGLVVFPLAAWKMGRLAGSSEPIPAFLALAAFVFAFDTNFTIYGGNIASTLAGEFSFSICLMLTLLSIGLTARGMDRKIGRAMAAVVIGIVALTHVLPVFLLIPALALLILMDRTVPRTWAVAGTGAIALVPIAFADGTQLWVRGLALTAVVVVFVSAMAAERELFERARWLLVTGPVAMLIAAFWLVPFVVRHPYFNDMGWEPIEHVGPLLLTVPMKIALPVAAIGAILAYTARERLGMVFAGTSVIFAAAVANVGDGPVWNARLLPFYYLSVYMTAAIGVAMILRLVGSLLQGDLERPDEKTMMAGTVAAAVAILVAVAMPLRIMPFGRVSDSGDGSYEWLFFSNTAQSFVPGWVEWNYLGYEEKESYREYRQVVETMATVGDERGCGRAMWEHSSELDRYGTPMALMLLPFWTDGCIGSMEGLYFESSASTPFHFLNQSMLSDAPSRPQRNLPYVDFDIDRGVAQLQTSGVRYYMAQSDRAIEAAESNPALTRVAEAQPFVIFEVAGSDIVEGLAVIPVVVSGPDESQVEGFEAASRFEIGWVSQAVAYYNDPDAYTALPAEDGPAEWPRAKTLDPEQAQLVEQAQVSNVVVDTSSISFSVDRPGTPVVVKTSYFPNWKVDGADGPYRVGPNQMVVVPTGTEVELSYGRSMVDLLAMLLSVVGLVGVFLLWTIDRRREVPILGRPLLAERARLDNRPSIPQSEGRFVERQPGPGFDEHPMTQAPQPAPRPAPQPAAQPASPTAWNDHRVWDGNPGPTTTGPVPPSAIKSGQVPMGPANPQPRPAAPSERVPDGLERPAPDGQDDD